MQATIYGEPNFYKLNDKISVMHSAQHTSSINFLDLCGYSIISRAFPVKIPFSSTFVLEL